MEHRNLVIAYALTWTLQLGYASWVALRWMKLRKEEKSFAENSSPR